MPSTPLISCAELAAHLGDAQLRIIDCRHELSDPDSGRRAYAAGRIPGAIHAHLDEALSDPRAKARHGRHPLPESSAFARWCADQGIAPKSPVVAYDQDGGAYAARLWWLLTRSGWQDVRVLDGGYAAWQRSGGAIETGAPSMTAHPAATVEARALSETAWLPTDALQRELAGGRILLLDARGAPRFRGEVEPIDPVAGHIPGAHNRPFTENLGADGNFKPPARLRAEFQALLGDTAPEQVVHMCGSGVTACHNLLAMEHAGLPGSRLYADSWSGWILDPQRPVARGE